MEIKGFSLINEEKVERAIKGTLLQDGSYAGGVQKPDGSVDDGELLAAYDRLGGLIRRGTDQVKTGSFYDFRNKVAKKEPEVIFVYKINGKIVEVKDGQELPGIVKAARILAADEAEEKEEAAEEKAEAKEEGKKVIKRRK